MNPTTNRYYGLDALRASMMLLGIVFHLAVPYTGIPFPGSYVTSERSWLLLITTIILHYFRMPTFFALSGFFSALLWERGGTLTFLRLRSKRVALVWLAALAVLSPVMALVSTYNHFASNGGNAAALTWNAITSFRIDPHWLYHSPLHLWFLEYLMLFCIVAAAVFSRVDRLMPVVDRWTGKLIGAKFRVMALAIPTAAVLTHIPLAVVPYPASFVPWLGVSLVYGWFYTVGWLIYRRRDLLSSLACNIKIEKTALPFLILVIVILVKRRQLVGESARAPLLDLAISLFTAVFMWSVVIVLIAAAQNIKPARWLPYLADSSYWIYLAHFPLASLVPALLRHWTAPPAIKVALSAISIFLLLLVVYDRLIRYGTIGRLLNGPRQIMDRDLYSGAILAAPMYTTSSVPRVNTET